MNTKINLQELEQKAYRSTFKNGLDDIFIGLYAMLLGFIPILDNAGIGRPWNFLIVFMPVFMGYQLSKKYLITPRFGIVKFGPKRQADRRNWKIFLAIFWAIIMLLGFSLKYSLWQINLPESISITSRMIFLSALFIGLPVLVGSYFLDFPKRFYLYTALAMVCLPAVEIMARLAGDLSAAFLTFGVLGVVMIIVGTNILIKFIRENPILAMED